MRLSPVRHSNEQVERTAGSNPALGANTNHSGHGLAAGPQPEIGIIRDLSREERSILKNLLEF